MSRRKLLVAALLACLVAHSALADEILNIGDAAPALSVSSWLKGDKIEKLDPAKIYVVEFWATWCGPCRASIPHLTELAHKFKDKVQFIGVDVMEADSTAAKPFINEMGEKMDYAVAVDKVADGAMPDEGAMAKNWLAAAEEHGIPAAFVIKGGKIVWIGHPMELEEPLTKIVDGKWDTKEIAAARLAKKSKERRDMAIEEKVGPLYQMKDYKGVVAAIDEAAKTEPLIADDFAWLKVVALCNSGNVDEGLKVSEKMLKTSDDAENLNELAWDLVDPDLKKQPDPRVAKIALKAAQRAAELSKERDPGILDTLAEAQFRTGDAAAAVASEEKAIKLLKANKDVTDDDLKLLKDHLDRYRKGTEKSGKDQAK